MTRSGPVVIGYDGTAASRLTLDEAAALLAPDRAIIVVVWEAGRAYDLLAPPSAILEMPPTTLDVRTAQELDDTAYREAEQLAQQGAALAKEKGLAAEGLTVADEVTVAETLVRVASDLDAAAIVVGAHNKGRLSRLLLGSTSAEVVRKAPCPVVVVREGAAPDESEH